jgi:hypothetical protein
MCDGNATRGFGPWALLGWCDKERNAHKHDGDGAEREPIDIRL